MTLRVVCNVLLFNPLFFLHVSFEFEKKIAVDLKLLYRWFGNVARFLNHNCTPNLEKHTVFADSHDLRMPRLAVKTQINLV